METVRSRQVELRALCGCGIACPVRVWNCVPCAGVELRALRRCGIACLVQVWNCVPCAGVELRALTCELVSGLQRHYFIFFLLVPLLEAVRILLPSSVYITATRSYRSRLRHIHVSVVVPF